MDATRKTRVLNQIMADFTTLSPGLRRAAKHIVDCPAEFAIDPIRDSAAKSGASANAFVRLASHLGFGSFEALREPFRKALLQQQDQGDTRSWLGRLGASGPDGVARAATMRNEMDVVARSLRLLSPEKSRAVLSALLSAKRVAITGSRASYSLASLFCYAGRMALPNLDLIPHHAGVPVEDMMSMGPEDVLFAITFPPYSNETIDALRLARKRGVKILLLSDSPLAAPGIEADVFVEVATQSTHFFGCFAGAMAVLECLLADLMREGGEAVAGRIRAYEDLRADHGVYWKPRRPHVRRP